MASPSDLRSALITGAVLGAPAAMAGADNPWQEESGGAQGPDWAGGLFAAAFVVAIVWLKMERARWGEAFLGACVLSSMVVMVALVLSMIFGD